MADLIIGHAHGTHLFLQFCSQIKCSAAKCSQLGQVAHVGVALMCYPDPCTVPAIWVWFCSLICCQDETNSTGSTQWGAAPESFYKAEREKIRCNAPLSPTPNHPHQHPKHFVIQPLTFSSRLVFFLSLFSLSCKQPGNKSGKQPADVAGRCVQDCST